jgi:hypothetical protein
MGWAFSSDGDEVLQNFGVGTSGNTTAQKAEKSWKDSIKLYFKDICYERRRRMELAHNCVY